MPTAALSERCRHGNAVTYLYGPDGARLKKVVGSSATLYLDADIGSGSAGAALGFLHRDNLTSARRITNASGTLHRTLRPTSPSASSLRRTSTRLLVDPAKLRFAITRLKVLCASRARGGGSGVALFAELPY